MSAANLSAMLFLKGLCLPSKRSWPHEVRLATEGDWPALPDWLRKVLSSLVSAVNLSAMLFLNGLCLPSKRNWPGRRRDWPPKVTGLCQQTGSFCLLARKRQHHFPTQSASLPRMFLRASLPRASETHFYKGSSPALRPLMLLSALRPGTVFAGIASFNLSS